MRSEDASNARSTEDKDVASQSPHPAAGASDLPSGEVMKPPKGHQ